MARKRVHACRTCPRGIIVRDAPQTLFERILKLVTGRRPYRCLECGRRFFERPVRRETSTVTALPGRVRALGGAWSPPIS